MQTVSQVHRYGLAAMLVAAGLLLSGCASEGGLAGSVRGPTYTSADGHFSVPFPVSRDMGGKVLTDGPRTVTFRDNWGARITFSALPFTQRSSMEFVLQRKGNEQALTEFAHRNYGDSVTVHYYPDALGGAVALVYLRATGQRTGVAAFVRGQSLYVVETDLLPGVQMLGRADEDSVKQRDHWLEGRALALAETMDIR